MKMIQLTTMFLSSLRNRTAGFLLALLLLCLGTGVSAQTTAADTASTDSMLALYHTLLLKQRQEKSDTYHAHINELNNEFQAKALRKQYNEFRSLYYTLLLVGLVVCLLICILIIRKVHRVQVVLRQNEAETRRLLSEAQDLNTMKAHFLKEVSYKIRTPLNTVMGLSEVLAENPELLEAEDMQAISEAIQHNSAELQQLVTAVLDLSRLEAGMMKFTLSNLSLSQICQDAVSAVCLREESGRLIRFSNSIPAGRDTVHTDVTRLTQLMAEMIQRNDAFLPATEEEETSIRLSECKEDFSTQSRFARVEIFHAPIAMCTDKESLGAIRLQIAKLFVEHFGGTFALQSGNIVFIFPLK